eukprot:jgi/Mesvir1/15208/Mv06440-RA.1
MTCTMERPLDAGHHSVVMPSWPKVPEFHPMAEGRRVSAGKIKLLVSFGGSFQYLTDNNIKYVGGDTRLMVLPRDISYAALMYKLTEEYDQAITLKYHLPGTELDFLVSVSNDEDLANMMDEIDQMASNMSPSPSGSRRLHVYLFPADECTSEYEVDEDVYDVGDAVFFQDLARDGSYYDSISRESSMSTPSEGAPPRAGALPRLPSDIYDSTDGPLESSRESLRESLGRISDLVEVETGMHGSHGSHDKELLQSPSLGGGSGVVADVIAALPLDFLSPPRTKPISRESSLGRSDAPLMRGESSRAILMQDPNSGVTHGAHAHLNGRPAFSHHHGQGVPGHDLAGHRGGLTHAPMAHVVDNSSGRISMTHHPHVLPPPPPVSWTHAAGLGPEWMAHTANGGAPILPKKPSDTLVANGRKDGAAPLLPPVHAPGAVIAPHGAAVLPPSGALIVLPTDALIVPIGAAGQVQLRQDGLSEERGGGGKQRVAMAGAMATAVDKVTAAHAGLLNGGHKLAPHVVATGMLDEALDELLLNGCVVGGGGVLHHGNGAVLGNGGGCVGMSASMLTGSNSSGHSSGGNAAKVTLPPPPPLTAPAHPIVVGAGGSPRGLVHESLQSNPFATWGPHGSEDEDMILAAATGETPAWANHCQMALQGTAAITIGCKGGTGHPPNQRVYGRGVTGTQGHVDALSPAMSPALNAIMSPDTGAHMNALSPPALGMGGRGAAVAAGMAGGAAFKGWQGPGGWAGVGAGVLANGGGKEAEASKYGMGVDKGASGGDAGGNFVGAGTAMETSGGLRRIYAKDIEILEEMGRGSFGMVFRARWRGMDVAVKRLRDCVLANANFDQQVDDFWQEVELLAQLQHPNIVDFYGVVADGTAPSTVTEFMVDGSLKKVLRDLGRPMDYILRLVLARGAARGMAYLHGRNMVHFDLKGENLLVKNVSDPYRAVCKVTDFGLSKIRKATFVSGALRGTLPFMAPELMVSESGVTEKVDVYSYAIVLWEMLTAQEPYAGLHHAEIIGGVACKNLRPPVPSWCEPAWSDLMHACWDSEPSRRPSFNEVAERLTRMLQDVGWTESGGGG